MKKCFLLYLNLVLLLLSPVWLYAQQSAPTITLEAPEAGAKTYVARESVTLKKNFSYKATGTDKFNAKIDQTLVFPPTENTYAKADGTITTDPTQGGVVGAITGQFAVSPSGAATYSIPIECPPGINGMQPSVSLSYSSQGGNGIAGWGWNVSGMSAICRIGSTVYHDNKVAAPQLTTADNLMLDGQRLILVSGSNLTDGARYRTESESYSDITMKSINGFLCFEVKTKAGMIMEFGSSATSYIEAQGKSVPLCWLLTKVKDANGNYMSYNYLENNSAGEFQLARINYTSNDSANVVANDSVVFKYDIRSDKQTGYTAGALTSQTLILKTIKSISKGVIQREYRFDYTFDGFYNKLTEINETGANGEKYNPTIINWNKEGTSGMPTASCSVLNSDLTTGQGMDKNIIFVDMNNDGMSDAIRLNFDAMMYQYIGWEVLLSKNKGTNFELWQSESLINQSPNRACSKYQLLPGDFNKDGKTDLLEVWGSGSTIDVLLNQDNQLVRQNLALSLPISNDSTYTYEVGDYNGDGNQELLVKKNAKNSGINSKISLYCLQNNSLTLLSETQINDAYIDECRITDINGNGISELFFLDGYNGSIAYEYNSSTNKFESLPFVQNASPVVYESLFGDINGDGKTDVLLYNKGASSNYWSIKLSTGNGFVDYPNCPLTRKRGYSPETGLFDDNYILSDYNGDGRIDIAEIYKDGSSAYKMNLYYFNGANFITANHTINTSNTITFAKQYTYPYYDIDGDGKCDLLQISKYSYINSNILTFKSAETERQITSVTDGMNRKTKVEYKPLTDSSVYSLGADTCTNTVNKICIPMSVVSAVKTDADSANYNYQGLMVHRYGKGMLGFDQVTTNDITQNRKSVSQFGYNTTYFNVYLIKQIVSTLSGTSLATTDFHNKSKALGGKRIFPYVDVQTTTDNLSGLTSKVESLSFDSWGNPLIIKSTKGNIVETKRATYIQKGAWCPNKTDSLIITRTDGSESFKRTTLYGYNDKGNPTKETVDPSDVNSITTEYKSYDYFGHPRQVDVKANGITRSSSSSYTPSGKFILSKTNVLGETILYSWNDTTSLLNSETSRLGKTTYKYDGFGRQAEVKLPDGKRKANALQWASPGNSLNAKYYAYSESSGNSPTWIWYDALGREIRKDSYGLNGNKICVSTEYYANNQIYRVSEPYFEPNAANKSWAATYKYDTYGRPDTLTTPMGKSYYTYNGKTTTVTTPEEVKETTVDNAGQTITSKVNGKAVSYAYYASGLTKTATPEGGQAITTEYNLQGKRTRLIDPDAGTVRSGYNGFGELLWEKQKIHASKDSITTTNNYAANGLLSNIVRNDETTVYKYDALYRVDSIEIVGKHVQKFAYDNFDRVIKVTERVTGKSFTKQTEYDALGRTKKEIYPSGYYTYNVYDTYGNLTEVKDKSGRSIWKAIEENARGQLTKITKGGKETTFAFDERGLPTLISASGVFDASYSFDAKGNLEYRTDNLTGQQEKFLYDTQNRLTNWDVYKYNSLTKANSITYNPTTGNISSKSDLGNFTMNYGEGNNKPHALTSISSKPAAIPSSPLSVTYTDFKKIATLNQGDSLYTLSYGVDDQRRKSVYSVGGVVKQTRYYLGDYEEEVDAAGNVRKIHYLSGAILIQNNGKDSLLYTYSDYQGSLMALTDESGNVDEKYAYDPWGARRNVDDWSQKDTRTHWLTNRGYTGHEHIDAFGIINMNGRVYDPLTSMFLSPDPFVQAPDSWINYNRYGYCMNNPFKYTDPSGYSWFSHFFKWVGANWKTIVTIAATVAVTVTVGVLTGGLGLAAAGLYAGAAGGLVGGILGTALNGGNLKQCLIAGIIGMSQGAFFGAISGGVTSYAPAGVIWGGLYGAGTQGVLSGVASEWNGGSFKDGFAVGAGFGLVGGSVGGYMKAQAQGLNPWTGSKIIPDDVLHPLAIPTATPNGLDVKDPILNGQLPDKLYHYTPDDPRGWTSIGKATWDDKRIWLTPDGEMSSSDALSKLAIKNAPNWKVEISTSDPSFDASKVMYIQKIGPMYSQPGGGIEVVYKGPLDLNSTRVRITRLPK